MPISKIQRQDPPNALQVELVEGCSLNCTFCGVQGIRDSRGGYKFMTSEMMGTLVEKLADSMAEYGWNPRVEFAVHGEPTMHPDLIAMVSMMGALKPRELIMVSNGTGLARDPNKMIDGLVAAGITSFCLDEYDGCDFVQKIRERYTGNVQFYDYTGEQSEKFRSSKRKPPYVVIKEDVSHLDKPYDKLNTHCGGGGPVGENTAIGKRCAKPFRELTVRWDGNVALCCNDFRGVYKIGNIGDLETLDHLWQSLGFEAARRMLYAGDRDFHPCKFCDALSPRVGLLPDKYGKKSMPAVTAATLATIDSAIAGRPYTTPVLRGWEIGQGSACLPDLVDLTGLKVQPIDD